MVPPRPKRSVERSISPNRDSYARSPLNDPSFIPNGKANGTGLYSKSNLSASSLPQRPPSVSLPSIGQEGTEYANLDSYNAAESAAEPPAQTKNVAGDLPLHAPKASLPASSAKARVSTVTRTDSSQAAAAGIGKVHSEQDSTKPTVSPPRSNSTVSNRPSSIHREDSQDDHREQGIPEIGLQIPLYKNAGDVQAPTPSPSQNPQHTAGIGFFNDGSQPTSRHHGRTKSGREIFKGPPGSYGLHGHGTVSKQPLEKAWYDKHPEALAKEAKGEYGPAIQEGRKEYMLSSEELNKLVHTSGKGIGTGIQMVAVTCS